MAQVSNAENERIDQKFGQLTLNERVDAVYDGPPRGCNEIASLLVAISPTLHDQTLYERMSYCSWIDQPVQRGLSI